MPADATGINISNTGIVSVTTPGNDIAQEVGQISLANFSNPRGLTPVGKIFLFHLQKVVLHRKVLPWMVALEKFFKVMWRAQM